jgi:hypothetical protein
MALGQTVGVEFVILTPNAGSSERAIFACWGGNERKNLNDAAVSKHHIDSEAPSRGSGTSE